jgi:gliding motility-associated-like protein/uncharacterized repeat protein (TIGR01451 family)
LSISITHKIQAVKNKKLLKIYIMKNIYFQTINLKLLYVLIINLLFLVSFHKVNAQVCGTPGVDGPVNISQAINTYYPILLGEPTLNVGAQAIQLGAVPLVDAYGNDFGTVPISAGDLVLIIQMQDAEINYNDSSLYGSGIFNSFSDQKGGTGFTNIGNTGIFEYVIATNSVPLTGGNLTFKGTGPGGGVKNNFFNAMPTTTRGKRTFQIVRLPQYSNLVLATNITTPPFNGVVGGVIAFNVSGTFDFNGKTIDGSARGFRGGFSPVAESLLNNSITYLGDASNFEVSGKGEGIAGTPRFMWDGYNQVDNLVEGMPGGSAGRGAPGNAGGGGNDHNAGGGGGGNGGYGGLGGKGWQRGEGDISPLTGAGRPGFKSFLTTNPLLNTIVMGGGGGAGDANNALNGVKGGVGGAIIIINAGNITGTGFIKANGGNGAAGIFGTSPDGAGGGGAGGSVLLNAPGNSNAVITIYANGGNGGNTERDALNEHGPGGGGGGGIIRYNTVGATIISNVTKGLAGNTNDGGVDTITHGAIDGTNGYIAAFITSDLPIDLQINSNCFPVLETNVVSLTKSLCNIIDGEVVYEIEIKNTGNGSASAVALDFLFPVGIEFLSASASYTTGATGPSGTLSYTNTPANPLFGGFNIPLNGVVTITLKGKITSALITGLKSVQAQVLYLDPTRTILNPFRKITPYANSFGMVNSTYESDSSTSVPGMNFNGLPSTNNTDDIAISALPFAPLFEVIQPSCAILTGTIKVINTIAGDGSVYSLIGITPSTSAINNSTGIFEGLAAGVYQLTSTNSFGCISFPTSNIVLNFVQDAPTTTSVSICAGGTGTLKAVGCTTDVNWYTQATGGIPIFTGASFNPVLVLNSGLLNTDTPGTITYYAECVGGTGCRSAANFVINAIPTILSTTAGASCGSGSVTLSASVSGGTISWYDVATGGEVLSTGGNYTTPALSSDKIYYVQVTANGCTSERTAVTAVINTIPTIISTQPNERCGSGIVELKAIASAGVINWYANAQGGTSLGTGNSFTTPNISITTTYYVDATENGCTSTSRIAVAATLNIPSTIVLTSGSQNQSICAASTIINNIYTFSGSATSVVVSNLPTGLISTINNVGKTVTISGIPTESGTYTISTVGNAGSCISATIEGIITLINNNTVGVASSSPVLCVNTQLLNITHSTTGATAIGSAMGLPNGVIALFESNTITISGVPTTAGTYNYSIPLIGGCGEIMAKGIITVIEIPQAPIAINQTVCSDGSPTQTLTATATGDQITWYTDQVNGTLVTSPTLQGIGTITYYAQASNGTCSSLTRTPFVLTINNLPVVAIANTNGLTLNCNTQNTVLTASGGTSYLWSTGETTASITVTTAGTFTVTAKNANGCTAQASVTTTMDAIAPLLSLESKTNILCFGGNNGAININVTVGQGPYSYLWTKNDSIYSTTKNLDKLVAGSYKLIVTSANGCKSDELVVVINQPVSAVTATANITNNNNCINCNTGSITQTVTGGTAPYRYLWSNGATTKDVINLATGLYTVTITDTNGCVGNYSYTITESGIALVKVASIQGTGVVGDVINYFFIVTNTGNTTLRNIIVKDTMRGLQINGNPIVLLDAGQSSSSITGTYIITQADVDAGIVTNTAIVTALDPDEKSVSDVSGTEINNDTPTVVPLKQLGSIVITKDGVYNDDNKDGLTNVGDKINYKFTVTNTGNVTLTNVTVTDLLPGLILLGNPITLEKGVSNSTAFTAVYTITQADIDKGAVYNIATVTGTTPVKDKVTATSTSTVPCTNCTPKPDCLDCTITLLTQTPKIEVVKRATTTNYSLVGDIISYTIEVKNTGNVTLYNIIVTDPLTTLNTAIPSLAPSMSITFNENYTITKADLVNNTVVNTASAKGVTIDNKIVSDTDTAEVEKSLVLGCGDIVVHNAFSPNGDAINDVFIIDNIGNTACYPENTVEIYNRWGVLVFETKNYNNQSNNFEGISRGRTTVSQSSGLPTGTYFYILNYTSVDLNGDIQTNKEDGFLYLTR